ncbi:hypothetical protein CDAR_77001 [Caerostris darwini]|uniref:Uncharacterized protein n=1 Tax=Caerostris darwini TaxID=1538125 RepID=A0AAV4R5X2_9ARAC|nr:hypothetical protein CDAR_77001 [Caerostris darwini]
MSNNSQMSNDGKGLTSGTPQPQWFDFGGDLLLCWITNMESPIYHTRNCTELIYVPDDITARYWEARRRMADQSQIGLGKNVKRKTNPLHLIN